MTQRIVPGRVPATTRHPLRILMVSQWYHPEPEGRVSSLAENLARIGHQVTVVTGFPNLGEGRVYEGYRIQWRQWEERRGVKILRLPLFPDHSRSVIRRSLNYASFSASLFSLGSLLVGKADVVWGYTILVGLPAIWLSSVLRAPLVLDIPDLWPDALYETEMLREGLFTRVLGRVSHFAYTRSDALTVWNPGFKRSLVERGIDSSKIRVIENWVDGDLYQPVEREEELARDSGMAGKFNVVFAGNIGFAQRLEVIIDAAARLEGSPDIQFVIIGDGSCFSTAREYAMQREAKNVVFLGRRPAAMMPMYFAIADVLLVHLKDKPLFRITVPGKTQAYLACAKPILMAVQGDGASLVREHGCGLACPPENPDALADAVLELRALGEKGRRAMGAAGRQLFLRSYTKDVLMAKMEEILVRAAAREAISE